MILGVFKDVIRVFNILIIMVNLGVNYGVSGIKVG